MASTRNVRHDAKAARSALNAAPRGSQVPCERTSEEPRPESWKSSVEHLLVGQQHLFGRQQHLLDDHKRLISGLEQRQAEHAKLIGDTSKSLSDTSKSLGDTSKSLEQVANSLSARVGAVEAKVQQVDNNVRSLSRRVDMFDIQLAGAKKRGASATKRSARREHKRQEHTGDEERWTRRMLDVLKREAFARHLPHRLRGALGASLSSILMFPYIDCFYLLLLISNSFTATLWGLLRPTIIFLR